MQPLLYLVFKSSLFLDIHDRTSSVSFFPISLVNLILLRDFQHTSIWRETYKLISWIKCCRFYESGVRIMGAPRKVCTILPERMMWSGRIHRWPYSSMWMLKDIRICLLFFLGALSMKSFFHCLNFIYLLRSSMSSI